MTKIAVVLVFIIGITLSQSAYCINYTKRISYDSFVSSSWRFVRSDFAKSPAEALDICSNKGLFDESKGLYTLPTLDHILFILKSDPPLNQIRSLVMSEELLSTQARKNLNIESAPIQVTKSDFFAWTSDHGLVHFVRDHGLSFHKYEFDAFQAHFSQIYAQNLWTMKNELTMPRAKFVSLSLDLSRLADIFLTFGSTKEALGTIYGSINLGAMFASTTSYFADLQTKKLNSEAEIEIELKNINLKGLPVYCMINKEIQKEISDLNGLISSLNSSASAPSTPDWKTPNGSRESTPNMGAQSAAGLIMPKLVLPTRDASSAIAIPNSNANIHQNAFHNLIGHYFELDNDYDDFQYKKGME